MAQLNGNNAHLEWAGLTMNLFWAGEISHEQTVDTEDITAGSGSTHVKRAPKLIDSTTSLYIIMDETYYNTYKDVLQAGLSDVLVWGPRGSGSGMPKLEGKHILTGLSVAQSIDKTKIGFEVSFEQADTPVSTLSGTLAGSFA